MTSRQRGLQAMLSGVIAAVVTSVTLFAAYERVLSATDAVGAVTLTCVGAVLQLVMLHYPIQHALWRRQTVRTPVGGAAMGAFLLNAPVLLLIAAANSRGGIIGRSEATIFATALTVSAGTYGAVFFRKASHASGSVLPRARA